MGVRKMPKLRVAVCEDQKEEQEFLENQILACQIPVTISFFYSGESFLNTFEENAYDLIFMDIYMGALNGIEAVKEIRRKDPHVLIAFTTSSLDHALDAYRLDVLKYLEKPVRTEDIRKLLTAAGMRRTLAAPEVLSSDTAFPAAPEKILFAEQNKHQILFHLDNGEIRQKRGKLDDLESWLKEKSFFRCHKSYLVNLSFISGFDPDLKTFTVQGGKNVYIRRADLKRARMAWENHLFDITEKRGLS